MMRRMLNSIALLLGPILYLGGCAVAVALPSNAPQDYIGRKFWYEPEHEKYSKTEFHRVPNFDKGKFHIQKKTRFEVLSAGRGWFKLRLEGPMSGDPTAYLPTFILRSRLYTTTITESFQASFRKASIFEEDPDVIRRRLEPVIDPGSKSSTPPPWKIRNRGFPSPGSRPPEPPEAGSPMTQ